MTSDNSFNAPPGDRRAATGIAGLDYVLNGGFPAGHLFLIEGMPGSGKTTLALEFLMAGAREGERCLYITLAETRTELEHVAASHDWSLDGLEILELVPPDEVLEPETQYTVFHPSDVELGQTMRTIYDAVDRIKPARVVIDSLSEMRLLAQDPLRVRRQVLALKHFFLNRGITVLLLDDVRSDQSDLQFASTAHGAVLLEQMALNYGAERRRLRVIKLRGQRYQGGYHDFTIATGGLRVFPRLVAATFGSAPIDGPISSGDPALDALNGGGLDRGTSALLVGPAGVGKSVLATEYALATASRGEKVAGYLFDERLRTFCQRAAGLQLDVETPMKAGLLALQQLDPAEVSPGEFAHMVVEAVEKDGASLVIIDSLSGYMNAMPEDRLLNIHLHELLSYITQRGATAILTLAQHGPFANGSEQGAEISYLADSIFLLRYFESAGTVRQAVSVMKKRTGAHEQTIREYRIGAGGYHVGQPLDAFQGVLTGVPTYIGRQEPLLGNEGGRR